MHASPQSSCYDTDLTSEGLKSLFLKSPEVVVTCCLVDRMAFDTFGFFLESRNLGVYKVDESR